MVDFFGVMKSKSKSGEYIVGYALDIDDDHYLQIVNGNSTVELVKVNTIRCAREIIRLPNKESLFEFDVFETPSGQQFYITLDLNKFAVVYCPVNDSDILEPNINIFDCKYLYNVKIDILF